MTPSDLIIDTFSLNVIDFAKAFDTIQHDTLLRILPNFGTSNKSLLWFKSYLSNRQQIVKLNDVNSNASFIKYGVPQW